MSIRKRPGFIVALLVALGAAGFTVLRSQAPPVQAPKLASAPAAAPVMRTKEQASLALMSLPELKAWSRQIETKSGGKVRGALIEDDPAPRSLNGKYYWQFSFVENAPDAVHRWESFLVASTGDEILVEDFASDQRLSLDQWRKDKAPLSRSSGQ